jgi:RNA polymerase sporulation-specific sigma factor
MDKELTDEELVLLAQAGDSDAEEQLYTRYKPMIKQETRPFYLVGGDSDDLIQVAMIGLMNAVRCYKEEGKAAFRTYATYCIRNKISSAITAANRNKHQPIANYVSFYTKIGKKGEDGEELQLLDTLEAGPGTNPEEVLLDREEQEEKQDTIKKVLSPMERSVARLYIEGNSVSEIAAILSKEEKSVNNALFRIRKKLKGEMEKQNTEDDDPK